MTGIRRYWTGANKAPAQDHFFVESLDSDLWKAGDTNNWDTCWHTGMPARDVFANIRPGATINHIPGNNSLTVKSMLYATLSGALARAPTEQARAMLDFFPHSYLMPGDYHTLQREAFDNPQKRWIIKPKRLSRGRGIRVLEDAGEVPFGEDWLVQDYLDRPHLLDGRKYVLRLYLLIASIEPLRVYLYRDGFVKLASEPYSTGDFDNLFAHLTNPDVNATNDKVASPVVFRSFDEYRGWLATLGADADALFARVREIAIISAIAAREQMRARTNKSGAPASACYELIGLDCMVDADLKPWLLECNLSPSLETCAAPEDGGAYEEATKRGVVEDLVSLLALNQPDGPALIDWDDSAAIITASAAEQARAGRFERIYPAADASRFLPFMAAPRHGDWTLAKAVSAQPLPPPRFSPADVQEVITDDQLTLFCTRTGRILTPEPAPGFIWLKAAAGEPVDEIAAQLATTMGVDETGQEREALSRMVANAVADWACDGLLQPRETAPHATAPTGQKTVDSGPQDWIEWAGTVTQIRASGPEVGARIADVVAPLHTRKHHDPPSRTLNIVVGNPGYAITTQSALVKSGLRLSELAPALREALLDEYQASEPGAVCLSASCLQLDDGRVILFANDRASQWDAAACKLADTRAGKFLGSAAAIAEAGRVLPLALPGRMDAKRFSGLSVAAGDRSAGWHSWSRCERGALIRADVAKADSSGQVGAVIFAKEATVGAPTGVKKLAGADRLKALAGLCRPAPARPHAPADLFSWAEDLDIFEVRYADPRSLVEFIARGT